MQLKNYRGDELTQGFFSLALTSNDLIISTTKRFDKQKKRGIHKGTFKENIWQITDGYEHKRIDFGGVKYSPKNMSKEDYLFFLKAYTCKYLDERTVSAVAGIMNKLIRLTNETHGFAVTNAAAVLQREEKLIEEFLEELHIDDFELNVQKVINTKHGDNRRNLSADFWTYFVMDFEIKAYWKEAGHNEKLIYAPLYLYWILGHIIPMRPEEFCMMRRNCIKNNDGKYYINVTKSGIKGKGKIITNNRTTQDKVVSFCLDQATATEFLWYQESVKEDMAEEEQINDFLFNNVTFNRIAKPIHPRKEQFKGTHLDKLKNQFLRDVLMKKGYKIKKLTECDICSDIENKWISVWRLGDLRHLAMINLIVRGIDPTIIMIFAGHDNITQACHYYSNVSEMNGIRLRFEERYHPEYTNSGGVNIRALMTTSAGMEVMGGMCLFNGSLSSKAENCAKYLFCDADGCPYFWTKSKKMEAIMLQEKRKKVDKLMEQFVNDVLCDQKEQAMEALVNVQREIKVLERMS